MELQNLLWILLAILSGSLASSILDCQDENSFLSSRIRCYTSRGMQLETENEEGVDLFFYKNPTYVCSHMKEVEEAHGCMIEIMNTCLGPYLPLVSKMVELDKIVEGYEVMCNRIKNENIDTECAASKAAAIVACEKQKEKGYTEVDVATDYCQNLKWSVECKSDILSECDCNTTQTFVVQGRDYENPSICPQMVISGQCVSAAADCGISFLLLLLAAFLAVL